MLSLKNTTAPHTGDTILYKGTDLNHAKKAMIMIHGRGSNATSMADLIRHIKVDDTLFVIPQARNFTWYPFRFIEKRETNEPGISSGLALIDAMVKSLVDAGIEKSNIYLLGFSQGSCLCADYTARHPDKFGGVFILSGGLIGDTISENNYNGDLQQTPVFLGCSSPDFHIPEERVHQSAKIFENLHAKVTKSLYPDMGHTINVDEIDFINKVLAE